VIADKAYDSDALRERLARRGIELIAPHRSNRKKPATQDGRALPSFGGALRSLAHNLSRVLSYRLLHDRSTEGCAIASSNILKGH